MVHTDGTRFTIVGAVAPLARSSYELRLDGPDAPELVRGQTVQINGTEMYRVIEVTDNEDGSFTYELERLPDIPVHNVTAGKTCGRECDC